MEKEPESISLDTAVQKQKPVPVTLITGFLGSGKTTLVKHILTAEHGYKIAVILNEFGEEAGIESSFVPSEQGLRASSGEWIEIANGCLCCSVKDDFVTALETLLTKTGKFDYILIETTGLANPGPIASKLWTDEELEAGIHLDSVVTVVDALNISRQLHEQRLEGTINEAQLQIAYADIVLLNKIDLVDEEAIDRAEADVRAINSSIHIVHTSRSKIPLELLLNRGGYTQKAEVALPPIDEADEEEAVAAEAEAEASSSSHSAHAHVERSPGKERGDRLNGGGSGSESGASLDRVSSHHHPPSRHSSGLLCGKGHCLQHEHRHDDSVRTISLKMDEPLDLEKFKQWMDILLWDREDRAEDVYRVKGILSVAGSENRHMVQAVYELYEVTEGGAWASTERRQTRIVFIGRGLVRESLTSQFQACALRAEGGPLDG